jgi:hypothetical protein
MANVSKSVATLRVIGDNLLPNEITEALGCSPTKSMVKGEVIRNQKSGREFSPKTGMWRLDAKDFYPENIDAQVAELLGQLTEDLSVWSKLKERYDIDFFCGLFMEKTNEGAPISANTLVGSW